MKRFIISLAIIAICGVGAYALKSKARDAGAKPAARAGGIKSQDPGITIYNNTSSGRWRNVPIEITSLGDYNYRITNVTGIKEAQGVPPMKITRFMLALYVAFQNKPLHGEGARVHQSSIIITD